MSETPPVEGASWRMHAAALALALSVLAIVGGIAVAAASTPDRPDSVGAVPGGSPDRGVDAIALYGCGSCHEIPGISGANGLVGPPLIHWSRRETIAGHLPNQPSDLIRWIESPQSVERGTDMPDMGVSAQDARDIAAYLFSLT